MDEWTRPNNCTGPNGYGGWSGPWSQDKWSGPWSEILVRSLGPKWNGFELSIHHFNTGPRWPSPVRIGFASKNIIEKIPDRGPNNYHEISDHEQGVLLGPIFRTTNRTENKRSDFCMFPILKIMVHTVWIVPEIFNSKNFRKSTEV